jgi:hypothetical protein
MGARNQVGIGLSYRPAGLQRLTESIPGVIKSLKIPSLGYVAVGIDSLESIPGLLKRLKIRALTSNVKGCQ